MSSFSILVSVLLSNPNSIFLVSIFDSPSGLLPCEAAKKPDILRPYLWGLTLIIRAPLMPSNPTFTTLMGARCQKSLLQNASEGKRQKTTANIAYFLQKHISTKTKTRMPHRCLVRCKNETILTTSSVYPLPFTLNFHLSIIHMFSSSLCSFLSLSSLPL